MPQTQPSSRLAQSKFSVTIPDGKKILDLTNSFWIRPGREAISFPEGQL